MHPKNKNDNQSLTKKSTQNKRNKQKLLHYKPKSGDQQRTWQIQSIVDHRVILQPIQASQSDSNSQKLKKQPGQLKPEYLQEYEQKKQFCIAWVQTEKQGRWENTWQPEQNIPEQLRLEYLLLKKAELLKKKKNTSSYLNTKLNLQKHIEFTQNKLKIGQLPMSNSQRFNASKKAIKMIQRQISQKQSKKQLNSKPWYFSYSSKTRDFQILINRFLNRKTNQVKNQPNFKNNEKSQTLKIQFLSSIKQQRQTKQFDGRVIDIPEKIDIYEQTFKNQDCMPKNSCLQLISRVQYIGKLNHIQYFILKFVDQSIGIVGQQDLVKFFPWAYEKYIVQSINENLQKSIQVISKINFDEYDGAKQIQALSYQIGLPKNYFFNIEKEQHQKKNFHYKIIGPSNSFDKKFLYQEKQQIKQMENPKITSWEFVEEHFLNFKNMNPLDKPLQIQINQLLINSKLQNKINQVIQTISSKDLFNSNSRLFQEWQKEKNQKREEKNLKKENPFSSVKIQGSFQTKQNKQNPIRKSYDQKTLSEICQPKQIIQKNKYKPIKQSCLISLIPQEPIQSLKRPSLNQIQQKRPQKKVKASKDQQQIQEIMQLLNNESIKCNEVYDSEDEQIIK